MYLLITLNWILFVAFILKCISLKIFCHDDDIFSSNVILVTGEVNTKGPEGTKF